MKTNRLIAAVILLAAGSMTMHVSAQEAIKAIIKKCESMENVNMNTVRNKDSQTKKLTRSIVNINFSNNEALAKEVIAAFNKDREAADQEMENRQNGKVNNLMLKFGDTRYSFSQGKEGHVSISVIEREDSERESKIARPQRPIAPLAPPASESN